MSLTVDIGPKIAHELGRLQCALVVDRIAVIHSDHDGLRVTRPFAGMLDVGKAIGKSCITIHLATPPYALGQRSHCFGGLG